MRIDHVLKLWRFQFLNIYILCVFSVNHNSIETLIGSNYTKWREDVEIALGLLDYEMAIEVDALAVPDADASAGAKAKYAKWVKQTKWLF